MSPTLIFDIRPLDNFSLQEEELAAIPHRHTHFEVIFLLSGAATCRVDLEEYAITGDHICYIGPGKMHLLHLQPEVSGYLLSFSREFFHLSMERLLLSNASCCRRDTAPLVAGAGVKKEMTEILRKIEWESARPGPFTTEVVRGLLKIFLLYLSRLAAETAAAKTSPGMASPGEGTADTIGLRRKDEIIDRFLAILEEKYAVHRTPADYAEALCITTNYLNEVVKGASGFTTSYHIQQRILLEAKRLAVYANSPMKQVAFQLGFDDAAHFSKFFKKAGGECFSEFKRKKYSTLK